MKGSKDEIRPGVWRLRVYVGHGRHASRTVHGTQSHAENELAALIVEVLGGQHAATPGTVGELLDRWFAWRTAHLSPSTVVSYTSSMKRLEDLRSMNLGSLRSHHIDALYARLSASGGARGKPLAAATVRQAHANLRAALGQAVKWGMIASNPAVAATPPPIRRKEIAPPTREEVQAALEAATAVSPLVGLYVRLAAETGARRSEMIGLRWSDFDFEEETVRFARGIVQGPDGLVEKGTKTDRVKTLGIGPRTCELAGRMRDAQRAERKQNRVRAVRDPFVFSRSLDGSTPWRPEAATKMWKSIAVKLGLPNVLHDLRHFMVSDGLARGHDVLTVAGRAGHRSAKMTLDVYGHFRPAQDRALAADLELD